MFSALEKLTTEKEVELAIQDNIDNGKFSFNQIAEIIGAGSTDERCWGIQILSQMNNPLTPSILMPLLYDDVREIQYCAAVGLRQNSSPIAIDSLIGLLSTNDSMLTRLAGDALISIGMEATSSLIEVSNKSVSKGVIESVRAIAIIKDKSSISTLFTLLKSESSHVRYWAEKGLNDMGVGMTFFSPN